jgi:hypothetical protein
MLRYACVRSKEEELGVFQVANPDSGKRPDITVYSGPLDAQNIILDVSVTCPLPGASGVYGPGLTRAQSRVQGRAAAKAYKRKQHDYGELAQASGLVFIPVILESPGFIHEHARKFLHKVAEYAGKVKLIPKDAVYKYWITRISVTLQKALATALYKRVIAVTYKERAPRHAVQDVDVLDMNTVHI